MNRIIILALLCWLLSVEVARADVYFVTHEPIQIKVIIPPMSIPCPSPPARMIKQNDGSYVREQWIHTTTQVCYSKEISHYELWSDLPEKGGRQIDLPYLVVPQK